MLYERTELQTISEAVPLVSLVLQKDMKYIFQETIKLLAVLVRTSMSTSEAKKYFSMLKRIKTFARNSMKEERPSALGLLSAEKVFLNNIEDFTKRVIDLFASKTEPRLDFLVVFFNVFWVKIWSWGGGGRLRDTLAWHYLCAKARVATAIYC
ncbi:unnamed protein product [Psylliodes chrysocephalus]|uniref:HAT C-terminal dimerisation domain-containing protein n=1 Tax=Psylliodes chrysocephalus TaxID=3402493 RepID=A0A9P0DAT4_9CUCU|nr:unnamed protein product [Psylliodes chrysocephala]